MDVLFKILFLVWISYRIDAADISGFVYADAAVTNPISGATLLFKNVEYTNVVYQTTSVTGGGYDVTVIEGTYLVTVIAGSYYTQTRRVDLEQSMNAQNIATLYYLVPSYSSTSGISNKFILTWEDFPVLDLVVITPYSCAVSSLNSFCGDSTNYTMATFGHKYYAFGPETVTIVNYYGEGEFDIYVRSLEGPVSGGGMEGGPKVDIYNENGTLVKSVLVPEAISGDLNWWKVATINKTYETNPAYEIFNALQNFPPANFSTTTLSTSTSSPISSSSTTTGFDSTSSTSETGGNDTTTDFSTTTTTTANQESSSPGPYQNKIGIYVILGCIAAVILISLAAGWLFAVRKRSLSGEDVDEALKLENNEMSTPLTTEEDFEMGEFKEKETFTRFKQLSKGEGFGI